MSNSIPRTILPLKKQIWATITYVSLIFEANIMFRVRKEYNHILIIGKGRLERTRVGVKTRARKFYFWVRPLTRAPGVR